MRLVFGVGLGLALASLGACSEAEPGPEASGGAEDGGVTAAPEDAAAVEDSATSARDAAPEVLPEPPATGNRAAIFVTSDVTSARSEHTAGAAFFTRTAADQSVTRKAVGPCVVETYGAGAGPKDVDRSAGKITISGGASPVVLQPAADATYPTVNAKGALFAGVETLTITGEGAAAPAFSLTLVTPSRLTLGAPSLPASGALKVARTAGLSATWSGASAGVVVVYLDAAGGSAAYAATCTFPAGAGAGVVPPGALADFPAVTGTFSVYTKTVAVKTSADGYVRATASTLLVSATGAGASGDAAFE